ncbi:hypothetical protein BD309DRAFT_963610 [Dichomitus squalens]|uniref:Uncharacterized protein n=2 Tax=Dichomitus squalens TaxID=114155 RepID=A0A4Q9NLD7_9APHY|nr:uncharacterized protein DICSQDRAFT_174867 [Dichomitus squalens LYAD-421 SS1]EJF56484.1 hypothetical protein DICSQDRAFT_174867 [Dichomitus squalens LYAD-421 SS1]TBU42210.1 hypothetical protein BD309DRAFT_963610 [Dichomitus squalens]TBU63593.1 hypothetical protein BD310DRAFT_587343 [Dichomitus squalens]
MPDYKPLIVDDVQHAITAVNDIVIALQRDAPLTSDLVEVNYSKPTVDSFHQSSQAVVNNIRAASDKASQWLSETGDQLSRNLEESHRVEASVRETSSQLAQTNQHVAATQNHIDALNAEINNANAHLSNTHRALSDAQDRLDRRKREQRAVRIGAAASLFFAPIVAIGLVALDLGPMEDAVNSQRGAVRAAENQLASLHQQLQSQQTALLNEQSRSQALSNQVAQLQQRAQGLKAEVARLSDARAKLAELSANINNCLHAVDAALSSSVTITSMGSMRNVVTGIKGIATGLSSDGMFAGPVAQLNDAAFGALDRRVTAIVHHRLTF